jgi:hypothetical protein
MRNTVVWSFLSLVALATSGLITGCDSDAKIAKSGVGESCDNTSDCNDGLKCIEGACYKSSTGSGGSENMGGEGTGATAATGPTPPVLGGEGESCTKRADCKEGLGCFNERCTTEAGGDGGAGPSGPTLGGPGETCGLTSDCGEGLACLPQTDAPIVAKAIGSNSVGVCTPIDSGLVPSGKTCGHECVEAADCCELPLAQQVATGAASCTELALLVADVANCATAIGANGVLCLAHSVYCDDQCGKNTWACEAGKCSYTAKCTKPNQVIGGCPAYSRGGTALLTTCNKAGKCAPEAVDVVGCAKDSDCDAGDVIVADYPADTCVEGECACNTETGGCYRKCSEDLDCPLNYNCDTDTSFCVPEESCTTDVYCVTAYGDIRAKCNEGVCSVPCEHDIDCNEGGLTNGNFSRVCGPEKTCVDLGCSSDNECPSIGDGVRGFCAEPPAPVPGATVVVSAITD